MDEYEYSRSIKMRGLDPNRYVYKYIPLMYLLQMLNEKKLRIAKVSTWEDPYENFFMKEDFYTYTSFLNQNVPVSTKEISDRLYGHSWTLKEESDAMWRIYSCSCKDKDCDVKKKAVKVKVKVNSLFSLVYTDDSCMATTSIGEVQYKTANELEKWRNSLSLGQNTSIDFPTLSEECLFIKRDSFQHEEEVRIVISEPTDKPVEDFLIFAIPDIDIFEEYILDPRLNQDEVESTIDLISKCGVNKNLISRSCLYDFFPKNIKI